MYKCSIEKKQRSSSTSLVFDNPRNLTDEESEESIGINEKPSAFVDFAKVINNGKFHDRTVNDVKSLQSAIIIYSLILSYKLIYVQVKFIYF